VVLSTLLILYSWLDPGAPGWVAAVVGVVTGVLLCDVGEIAGRAGWAPWPRLPVACARATVPWRFWLGMADW
jgi:hypothetical protein